MHYWGKIPGHHIFWAIHYESLQWLWILNLNVSPILCRIPKHIQLPALGWPFPAGDGWSLGLVGFGDRLKLLLGTGLLIHVLSGNFWRICLWPQNWRDVQKTWKGANHWQRGTVSSFVHVYVYLYIYIYIYVYIYICISCMSLHILPSLLQWSLQKNQFHFG